MYSYIHSCKREIEHIISDTQIKPTLHPFSTRSYSQLEYIQDRILT